MILPWFFSLEESQWSRGSSIRWFGWFWSNSHYALKNEKQCNGNEYLWDFFKNSVQYRVRHNVYIILGKKFILATLFRIFSFFTHRTTDRGFWSATRTRWKNVSRSCREIRRFYLRVAITSSSRFSCGNFMFWQKPVMILILKCTTTHTIFAAQYCKSSPYKSLDNTNWKGCHYT